MEPFIAKGARVIGNVELGDNVGIWYNAVVRADKSTIHIGNNSNIQDNCTVHVEKDLNVFIGDGVTVGHNAIVHGCTVGDNTLIGMGAIVMNRAVIGKNCIIGAGAIVTENAVIPDNSLVIGAPGKVKRELTEEEIQSIGDNASRYVLLASEYKLIEEL